MDGIANSNTLKRMRTTSSVDEGTIIDPIDDGSVVDLPAVQVIDLPVVGVQADATIMIEVDVVPKQQPSIPSISSVKFDSCFREKGIK